MFLFETCSGCARNALECCVAPGLYQENATICFAVLLSRDPLSLETANLQACNAMLWYSALATLWCDRKVVVIVVQYSCR